MNTTGRKGRGGRPTSPNARRGQVSVRLTDAERAALDEAAGPRGVAELLRAAALGHRPRLARTVPAVNAAAWRDLAGALANLNQLARAVNAGRLPDDLAPLLEDVRSRCTGLRAALLGAAEEAPG